MNIINLRFSCTMILLSILASTTIIGLTNSAPLSSYARRDLLNDHLDVSLLTDQRISELENEMFDSGNGPESTVEREKRIGSLSIVNSLDVLRQRVLLELARRKALQDQRQIDENRRFLESIGKRSVPGYGSDTARFVGTSSITRDYTSPQHSKNRNRSAASTRVSERTHNWFEENDPVFRQSQSGLSNDQTARMQADELRLL